MELEKERSFFNLFNKLKIRIMKRNALKIFISLLLVVVTYCFLEHDRETYYYGFGCTFCEDTLPYGLEVIYDDQYPQEFIMLDADGFNLVSARFQYDKHSRPVGKFIVYGYNDSSIIIKCTDSVDSARYLLSYKTGYTTKEGTADLSFQDVSDDYVFGIIKKYNWIELDEKKARKIVAKRSWLKGIILLLLFSLFREIRRKY